VADDQVNSDENALEDEIPHRVIENGFVRCPFSEFVRFEPNACRIEPVSVAHSGPYLEQTIKSKEKVKTKRVI
jgi:hypothetical protein